jgi:NADPH2:quinone reductase
VPRNLALLNTDGRHVSIAFVNGAKTEIDLNHVMRKRLIVTGSTLRPRSVAEKTELAAGIKTHIWPLVESGAIRPLLFKTFPLAQAAQAHEALEKGDHIGKIVLLSG